jgi:hypothetical protein
MEVSGLALRYVITLSASVVNYVRSVPYSFMSAVVNYARLTLGVAKDIFPQLPSLLVKAVWALLYKLSRTFYYVNALLTTRLPFPKLNRS